MVEDGSLEALELIVRLEPELLVQQPPARAVDLERVCLAAAAIEGQHQLAAQTLPQRLLAHEPLELGNQLRVPAERELGLDPLLERGQPLLLQPRSLGAGERVAQLGQRRSTPQRQPSRSSRAAWAGSAARAFATSARSDGGRAHRR